MTDLSKTIAPKSDQLNADDLIAKPMTVKVTKVALLGGDQPVAISYEGDNGKPFKPCKSMLRVLVQVWGTDGNSYIGKSMTLFRDEKVTFGGGAVGGIRISHMSHIIEPVTMALTASRANRKPYTVKPLIVTQQPVGDPELEKQGLDSANLGVESYKAWIAKLSPDQKTLVKHKHKEWSEVAQKVEQENEIPT